MHSRLAIVVVALFTLQGCGSDEVQDPKTMPPVKVDDGNQAGGGNPAGKTTEESTGNSVTKKAPEVKQPETEKTKPKKYKYADMRLAKMQFQMYCIMCHGKKGKGDGPTGKALTPRPRNWTDAEWQKTVTDDRLFKVIRDGGASVGLSVLMAPMPNKEYRTTRQEVIWALVAMVRGFSGKE